MIRRSAAAAPSLFPVLLALQCGVVFLQCSAAAPVAGDVSALMAFKRAIIEDPRSVLSDWTDADGNACDWHGVICSSPQGSVISLKLSNSSLKGFIAPALGRLSFLQELYLDHNLLFGTIPKQIGSLRNLRVLDLSSNRLAGPIPSELSGLSSVSGALSIFYRNFHSNGLTGNIPPELGKLQNLVELRLDRNRLKGSIPGSTAAGGPMSGQQGGTNEFKHPSSGHKHETFQQPTWLLVLEICTGILLVVFVIAGVVTASRSCKLKPSIRISSWNRSKSWNNEITLLIDSDMLKSLPNLSRQELEVACEDFSNIIGSSPETVVYKGTMKDGREVSVISLCAFEGHWTSHHELFYQNKVIDLARLNHENIAKFLGYCRESDPFSRMLVFEYASNGTLFEHLHYGEGAQLSWLRRMKIAIGIAQGLRYLHTELQPPFAISELNSNSVYVTEDFTPKLVDFECWKMMFTKREKAAGYFSSKTSYPGCQVPPAARGDWEASRPRADECETEDLAVLCSVVSRCIDPDPSKRPSMQIITGVLENGIDLSAAAILKESSLAWAELALAL
ncbi:hypothetical protein PR202_gb13881 [Eleusine coracana subsp. coracana]|uniref:Protein kinase domain-containing protein n=1 Tax=Eleusine coracana subsp. coracana TaxID=191504 RepID=A0AAV5ETU4_ELECO|nr:hypothetical protein PR202_gb13881 [Eleusine coracana subsp. coracana]